MNLALLLWLGLAASVAGLRHKYCIVGAGPGGLQVALALQERGRDYVPRAPEGSLKWFAGVVRTRPVQRSFL